MDSRYRARLVGDVVAATSTLKRVPSTPVTDTTPTPGLMRPSDSYVDIYLSF